MKNIGVIIRMWHEKNFEYRFNIFRMFTLPRLQLQAIRDFDICILAKPEHHERLESLDERIKCFTTTHEKFIYKKHGNFTYDQTVGLSKYRLQIRVDSDELVSRDFVAKCYTSQKQVVTFQPELFLLKDMSIKRMNLRYSEDKPSAFMGFYSDSDNYKCIYSEVFFRFGQYDVEFHKEGDCWLVIHDQNTGSGEWS